MLWLCRMADAFALVTRCPGCRRCRATRVAGWTGSSDDGTCQQSLSLELFRWPNAVSSIMTDKLVLFSLRWCGVTSLGLGMGLQRCSSFGRLGAHNPSTSHRTVYPDLDLRPLSSASWSGSTQRVERRHGSPPGPGFVGGEFPARSLSRILAC